MYLVFASVQIVVCINSAFSLGVVFSSEDSENGWIVFFLAKKAAILFLPLKLDKWSNSMYDPNS
jgi:hypothetical protein